MLAILTGVRQTLKPVVTCPFLTTKDVEHFIKHLQAIYICPLEKILVRYFYNYVFVCVRGMYACGYVNEVICRD